MVTIVTGIVTIQNRIAPKRAIFERPNKVTKSVKDFQNLITPVVVIQEQAIFS